eukprot:g16531.t2
MASFLRKAARMNLVAMDFVLQVTVVELVLGALDSGRTLSFELSRGTKTSGLPPKLVSTPRSEWGQTMQVVITLFLDKRSGRFQDKEYKLRLVQAGKGHAITMAPALATFTLDASLYAHLGAGPSVEQTVDLYAPKLNGPGGDATVYLRVRCCEPGGKRGAGAGRSVSAPNVMSSGASLQMGLPPRAPSQPGQMGLPLPPPDPSNASLLVGSSFGFSMSGSESRYSAKSWSTGSSAYSTPTRRRPGRPWSNEDLDQLSALSRSSVRSMRSKLGSKSFNDLDDSGHYSISSSKRSGAVAPPHHRTLRSSFSSFGGLLGSMGGSSSNSPGHQLALSARRAAAAAAADGAAVSPGTGLLTSESSSSTSSFVAAERRRSSPGGSGGADGRGGGGGGGGNSRLGSAAAVPTCTAAGVPYDRTNTVGYSRLLARFTKGPSPRGPRPRRPLPQADHVAESVAASRELGSGSSTSNLSSANNVAVTCSNGNGNTGAANRINTGSGKFDLAGKGRMFTFSSNSTRATRAAAVAAAATAGSSSTTTTTTPALPSLKSAPFSCSALGNDAAGRGGGGGACPGSVTVTAPPSAFSSPPGAPKQHPPLTGPPMPALSSRAGGANLRPQPPLAAATSGKSGASGAGAGVSTGNRARPTGGSGPITVATASACSGRRPSILSRSSLSLSSSTTGRSGGGGTTGGGWSLVSRTPQIGPPGGSASRGGGGGTVDGGKSVQSQAAKNGPAAAAVEAPAAWGTGAQNVESSAGGGGSAVAAPPSSLTLSEAETQAAGMEDKVTYLKAALLRSEMDLCQAKTELSETRQEAYNLRAAKDAAVERPTSNDIPALYHALEGSVVLLQIASQKMLHLEQTIAKHRDVLPLYVYQELQDCVTHDANQLSPIPGAQHLQTGHPHQVYQPQPTH